MLTILTSGLASSPAGGLKILINYVHKSLVHAIKQNVNVLCVIGVTAVKFDQRARHVLMGSFERKKIKK